MVFNNSILLGAAGQSGTPTFDPTTIGNSVWLNGSDEDINRTGFTLSSDGQKEFIISMWVNFNEFGRAQQLFALGTSTGIASFNDLTQCSLNANHTIGFSVGSGGSSGGGITTTRLFRDIGWYHLLFTFNSNTSILPATDRIRLYVNGELQTGSQTAVPDNQDVRGSLTGNVDLRFGRNTHPSLGYFYKGYYAQVCYLEGKSIQAGDFAVSDFLDTFTMGTNGSQFIPKKNSEIAALATTVGGNSACLDFANSSDLGNDISSNNKDFTATNMGSANQSSNTPSKVYPIVNALAKVGSAASTLAEGNTKATVNDNGGIVIDPTLPFSGLWYFEINVTTNAAWYPGIGQQSAIGYNSTGAWNNTTAETHVWLSDHSGNFFNNNGSLSTYPIANPTTGRFAVAWDGDNRALYFGQISGSTITWTNSGDPTSGSSKTGAAPGNWPTTGTDPLYFIVLGGGTSVMEFDFDEDDWTGSTNRPAAAKALNSANLTAPDFQGIDYFDATIYEGNGAGQRVGDFVPVTDVGTITKSFLCDGHTNSGTTDLTISTGISTAPTNTQVKTLSFWIKPVSVREQHVYNASTDATDSTDSSERIYIATNGEVAYQTRQNGSAVAIAYTAGARINDSSQWFNVVVALNYDSATASADTLKIYVDGVEQALDNSSGGSATLPAPGMTAQAYINKASTRQLIGTHPGFTSAGSRSNCYLAEMYMVDGQALDASAFGVLDTSTNRWVPKAPATIKSTITGTGAGFGGCGFYLDFLDASDLGDDDSGNTRDFTESATIGTENQVDDSPSLNFDNLGGAQVGGTISEGNTKAALGTGGNQIRSNFNLSSGKWYVESDIQATNNSASIGLVPSRSATWSNGPGRDANGGIGYETDGDVYSDNVQNATAEASFAAGDVVQMAIDMDAKKVYFGKNNTFGGDPAAGTGGHSLPASILSDGAALITLGNYSGTQSSTQQINYGQLLVFDGGSTTNGFKYTPPTGFKAVNQDNLDDTASKITAWAWIKNRDANDSHILVDRVRGVGEVLHSDATDLEATEPDTVQRFLQRGVQVGNDVQVNTVNESYVLWQWLVGEAATTTTINASSTTPTNSIASTVAAADAGHFSVVGYQGNSTNGATVAHSLGGEPELIFFRGREGSGASSFLWRVFSTTGGAGKYLRLNDTTALQDDTAYLNNTLPGSVVFTLGTDGDVNNSNYTYIAYCFRSVPGVCKVGKYIGNGNGSTGAGYDGPYINLGFKPKFILVKRTDSANSWILQDSSRHPLNPVDNYLQAESNSSETATSGDVDFLSDAIKIRNGNGNAWNANGGNYLYLAMADLGGNGTLPPIYGR